MATLAHHRFAPPAQDDRFFLGSALVMTAMIVAGFSLQLGMGRSTFGAPWLVHAHAIVFMGWVVIFLLQNILAAGRNRVLHRRLGWIATAWLVPMLVLGCAVTVAMVRRGQAPFFFQPLQFLIFDPVTIMAFVGLTLAAVAMRRQTAWHRRLHFCGMSLLLGPGIGRLLPLPLLTPLAYEATVFGTMLFPLAGVIADLRRSGRVHPAWWRGIAVIVGVLVVSEALTYSPIGAAIYRAVTVGSPGATVAPLAYPPPPSGPLRTGKSAT